MHHNVVTYYVLCFREYKHKPSFFQVSNMFLMSLAIADLTVGTIVMPISSAYAITGTRDGSGYVEGLIFLASHIWCYQLLPSCLMH